MTIRSKLIFATIAAFAFSTGLAQSDVSEVEDPNEVLKIAALEALISAPPERALPLAIKVLKREGSVSGNRQFRSALGVVQFTIAIAFWKSLGVSY